MQEVVAATSTSANVTTAGNVSVSSSTTRTIPLGMPTVLCYYLIIIWESVMLRGTFRFDIMYGP
jgi:hypothetical protein